MCGIVGSTLPEEVAEERFARMVSAMERRGPDDEGVWRGKSVVLGHRRLAVLDLSTAGAQPMANADGSIRIVYNGECYNHLELRKLLPGRQWRSHCDTETLLALYERFGPGFIRQIVGMFALAIYDSREERLYIYRDRFGEKPLYYAHQGKRLVFASDPRIFRYHPALDLTIDPQALGSYFLHNYIPGSASIYREVRKLPPGRMMEFDIGSGRLRIRRYWRPDTFAPPFRGGLPEAADALEQHLFEAARGQKLSDVPLGCFLSGGTDSSAVAMALQRVSSAQVRTFTIAFDEQEFDESLHAREVARHLETEHTELTARPEDCLDLIRSMPAHYAEPFADASMLPTALLSRLTREHVTVALSGDGADELFLGYGRYRWAEQVAKATRSVPGGLRRGLASAVAQLPHYKLRMLANGLRFRGERDLYAWLFTGWNASFASRLLRPVLPGGVPVRPLARLPEEARRLSLSERAGLEDLQHYLPDDILVKVDRAAMHYSLETRAPFLDHRLAEFALSLPAHFRMHGSRQKIVLKEMLFRHVPREHFERPKSGFAVPLRHWFRRELRPFLEETLAPGELARHGCFDGNFVQSLLRRHFSGRWNFERQLWALLMFQLWYREYHK